jgi:hypothetical protein
VEKAHLYEALYLVNHGIGEAVRGVQRLKKCPRLFMETYHKSMAGLERRRVRRVRGVVSVENTLFIR